MATNRYDVFPQADYSFMEYQQEDFKPDLSMLDSLLGGLQDEWDTGQGALKKIMPDYLRRSKEDSAAAKAFRAKYDQSILDIASAYASGDINAGRRMMKDATRQMEEDQLPGGEYFELERRNKEYAAEAERIRKQYEDNPRVAEYLVNQINIQPLKDPDTGNWGSINPPDNMYSDIPETDITGWFNTMLDNIKPTLIQQGWSKKQVDSITSIHDLQTLSGRQFNEIAEMLASSFPREYIQSISQRYAADMYHDPSTPVLNPAKVFDTDANGKVIYDDRGRAVFADTPLGNLFKGHTLAATHTDINNQLTKVKDDLSLEAYKSRLRKDEQDYEFNLGQEQYRTQVFTVDPGIPDFNVKLGDDGKAYFERPQSDFDNTPLGQLAANHPLRAKGLIDNSKTAKPFKEYIKSQEAQANPVMASIYGDFKDVIDGMDNKEAYEFVKHHYEIQQDKMKTSDAIYINYSPKKRDVVQKGLIGNVDGKGVAAIGNIRNMTIITQDPGKPPKEMSFGQFLQEHGLDDGEFVKQAFVHGDVRSDNSIAPSGHKISVSLGDGKSSRGKSIEIIASNISLQDAAFKAPEFTLQQARNNPSVSRTEAVFTGIPELDAEGKVYAVGRDIRQLDVVDEALFNLYTSEGYRDDDPVWSQRVEQLEKEKEKLIKNPKLNTFVRRQADLYNYADDKKAPYTLDQLAELKGYLSNPKK